MDSSKNKSLHRKLKSRYLVYGPKIATSIPSISPLSTSSLRPTKAIFKEGQQGSKVSETTPWTKQSVPTLKNSTSFSLETMTQPGNAEPYTPSFNSGNIPSKVQSDIPSLVPSQSFSNEPSDETNSTSSDEPSLSPTQPYSDSPSRQPSDLPTSQPFGESTRVSSAPVSTAPTIFPSDVPSEVYSEYPSAVPSIVVIDTPSTSGSAIPSEYYSESPSSIPTFVHSNASSTLGSAIPTHVVELPSASPSEVNSASPTSSPTYRPSLIVSTRPSIDLTSTPSNLSSENPTIAPSTFISNSIPGEAEVSVMPTSEKIPRVYSTVQLLEYTTSTENEMSENDVKVFQSICKSEFLPAYLPKTQEADYHGIDCVVLRQSIDKRRKLQETDERQFLLSVLLEITSVVYLPDSAAFNHIVSLTFRVFSEKFRLMLGSMSYFPSIQSSDDMPIVDGIQGSAKSPSSDHGMTSAMLVGALLGGAALALVVSALIIHSSRQSRRGGAENISPRELRRENRCVSPKARTVPEVIGFMTDSAVIQKEFPSSSPKSIVSEKSINDDGNSLGLKQCLSKASSLERTEGSGSLDSSLHGLDLLQSSMSSGNLSSEESKLPNRKKKTATILIGRRRKSDESSQKHKETQPLDSAENNDDSIDLECGVDSTSNAHTQARIEDCYTASPTGDYVQRSETLEGESFLQMHLDNAAHTGEVLNDLGQFEEEWHDRMTRVRVSASAETPRQANTHYRRPPRSRNMVSSSMSNDLLSEFTDAESV